MVTKKNMLIVAIVVFSNKYLNTTQENIPSMIKAFKLYYLKHLKQRVRKCHIRAVITPSNIYRYSLHTK